MIIESLDNATRGQLLSYLDLVLEKNKTLNLTRIDSREKGIVLHLEDSLSCLPEFKETSGPFLDIGTGGGFPGVPLAIATGRKGVLVDSIQKKARAVEEIVHELGFDTQIEVLGVRSEDLARERGRCFETVVARAVTSLPSLLELAEPLLLIGGDLITLRGTSEDADIADMGALLDKLGYKFVSHREIKINNEYERNILVFKKVKEVAVDLPRRNGMAQKRPLG